VGRIEIDFPKSVEQHKYFEAQAFSRLYSLHGLAVTNIIERL
jgi:hypothetical protein